jgi:uncharacterized protein (TIGR02145 family)
MILLFIGIMVQCDKKSTEPDEPEIYVRIDEPVTDIDGNVYRTIKIGDQIWMAENLKVTHYANGDIILTNYDNWRNIAEGGCWCNNRDESNIEIYGLLYNWFAVNDSRNIAPAGWHIPSAEEFQILIDYLGGENVAGGKMKETGTKHWESPNTGATNESLFTALPGGFLQEWGAWFAHLGEFADFWTSTPSKTNNDMAVLLSLYHRDSWARSSEFYIEEGRSIRCVKD